MLFKLINYEFKNTFKLFLKLLIIFISAALLIAFIEFPLLLFANLLIVLAIFYTAAKSYNDGISIKEGYLNFLLPTERRNILKSKLIIYIGYIFIFTFLMFVISHIENERSLVGMFEPERLVLSLVEILNYLNYMLMIYLGITFNEYRKKKANFLMVVLSFYLNEFIIKVIVKLGSKFPLVFSFKDGSFIDGKAYRPEKWFDIANSLIKTSGSYLYINLSVLVLFTIFLMVIYLLIVKLLDNLEI